MPWLIFVIFHYTPNPILPAQYNAAYSTAKESAIIQGGGKKAETDMALVGSRKLKEYGITEEAAVIGWVVKSIVDKKLEIRTGKYGTYTVGLNSVAINVSFNFSL